MSALSLDTRTTAGAMREQIKNDVAEFKHERGAIPSLIMVSVGEDPSIYDYIKVVTRNATKVGIRAYAHILPADIEAAELKEHLLGLNEDKRIHAVSLQTPLPPHLRLTEVASWLDPLKDVEGLHPTNVGHVLAGTPLLAPPPALCGMKLLQFYNINPAGRIAVVIGRNPIIGKPMAAMLTNANATVTLCHSQTPHLHYFSRQADILVLGVQQPGLITGEMVKPGAVVLDFGINYDGTPGADGRPTVVGDCDFESVSRVASALTPMPGGTGPLTVITLLQNTLKAASLQQPELHPEMGEPKIILSRELSLNGR